MKPDKEAMTRRRFLKTSTQVTALAGLSIATQAYGAGSDRIRVGLVGCEGRGTGAAAQALTTGESVILTAMGDAFENRLQSSLRNLKSNEQFGPRVKVPEDACFVGLRIPGQYTLVAPFGRRQEDYRQVHAAAAR
jgi:myo-inositol 2-dehydrogenase/D-chiro-inositol 1-dehydrogenase